MQKEKKKKRKEETTERWDGTKEVGATESREFNEMTRPSSILREKSSSSKRG